MSTIRVCVVLAVTIASCAACASRPDATAGDARVGGAGATLTGAPSAIDSGFTGGPITGTPSVTDTGLPGVIMVAPSYINGSEVAEPSQKPPPCSGTTTSSFSLSIADGVPGYRTPQEAIKAFVEAGDPAGYGTASTTWRIVSDGIETTATGDDVELDLASLPNANWIVDAGERCG